MNMSVQPWHELPPKVAAVVRPLLPALADEIIEAVGTVPAYQRPIEGEFGIGVRAGVEQALNHLVLEIEASGPVPRSDVYRRLGRGEMRSGRSLDSLLSAYRLGARVTWRRVAEAGRGERARARDALPAGGVDLRLHRRAVGGIGRGLRARADADRRGDRAGQAPPGAAARAGSCRRSPSSHRQLHSRQRGSCRGRWRRSRFPRTSGSRRAATAAGPQAVRLPVGAIKSASGR